MVKKKAVYDYCDRIFLVYLCFISRLRRNAIKERDR